MKLALFTIGYALCQLDAFELGGVPLPWVGLLFCLAAALPSRLMPFPGLCASFALLVALLLLSSVARGLPAVSDSFIAIRMLALIGFFVIVNWIATRREADVLAVEQRVVTIGVLVAVVALLVYSAHVLDLGDLPRNRLGTAGGEQAVVFTFEIGGEAHRALGTFREPSFLALALVLPACLALKHRRLPALLAMLTAMYLSYSMGALIALSFGLLLALAVLDRWRLAQALAFGTVVAAALLLLNASGDSGNPFVERLVNLASSDLAETSRGYVYENLVLDPRGLLVGNGIGYIAYSLAALLGSDLPVSALNLPLNIFGAGGLIGLGLILVWLLAPLRYANRLRRRLGTGKALLRLLPLTTFLVLYLSTFEELHIWHAVALGLMLGSVARGRRARAPLQPRPVGVADGSVLSNA
jgi:hypothetical protein